MANVEGDLTGIAFSVFTPSEVRNLSVVEVKTSLCFNALDHPLKDGLYDLRMGPSGRLSEFCETCRQTERSCPGHFGHVELPLPVSNPLFYREIFTLLRISCSSCFKIVIPPATQYLFISQLQLLDSGYIIEAQELENLTSDVKSENETDKASEEARGYIMKDTITKHMNEIDLKRNNDAKSTVTTESLRRQFIADFLAKLVKPKNCPYCKTVMKKITSIQNKIFTKKSKVEVADKFKDSTDESKSKSGTVIVLPEEARGMLRKIWEQGGELIETLIPVLKHTNNEYPTDLLFLEVILVPPPKVRPLSYVKQVVMESSQTRLYKAIINDCIILKHVIKCVQSNSFNVLADGWKDEVKNIKGETTTEKLHQAWLMLQSDVDHLLDANSNKLTPSTNVMGLKQLLEKKEGIIRMHMMGKRVNYAARSVITPDPNLNVEEIGIPEEFAKRLTYPVRVNALNVQELRRMVKNGPDVYPGATLIENENGSLIKLTGGMQNKTKREGVAKLLLKSVDNNRGKIVHRHLQSGDILLLNRQPTLHRPSIMAHKARILKGEKTLRMHYSNCKSYNADFDGDEMNAHLPQSELARSEAYNIVNVPNQYLVPKDGSPLGGLIQDHVISGVRLTVRGQFFDKQDYQQLVYQGLSHITGNIKLLPPSILKPKRLWSGKQIISTILINIIPPHKDRISLTSVAKINFKSWQRFRPRHWNCGKEFDQKSDMCESQVIIRKGLLLCGVLDKQHYGATKYSLTHCLYELYGGNCSSKFLDSLGKLFTANLQLNGFTIGVEDILVLEKPDQKRTQIIKKVRKVGDEAASKALDLEEIPDDLSRRLEKAYFSEGMKFRAKLDQQYKKMLDEYTNSINQTCLPQGLLCKFPDNNLQLMVTSGAKGSTVNTMQISCLLGQIELEGKRPPWMISGRSLPSFRPFETEPRAGGYIDGRFMTGITPQDFFFHCMAGREGLIDTAVKTSRSGYLQRCLIKHLEGVAVCYDGTVRDHDGSVIQFAYGEDGLEVSKSIFFKQNQMDFMYENRDSIIDKTALKMLRDRTDSKEVEKYKKSFKTWNETYSESKKVQPFTFFSSCVRDRISQKYWEKFNKETGRSKAYSKIMKKWKKLDDEKKKSYVIESKPDPITSKFLPARDFGVITESLETLINDYLSSKPHSAREKVVKRMIGAKYIMSLCPPGEPVGLLAAQSVGEPSTQMTLNTFHFAGRGEMNVTLGIPRLREILMTASKFIKTPHMDVPLIKTTKPKKLEKRSEKLRKTFRRVTIADVLEKITVKEKLIIHPTRVFTYSVRFQFLPSKCYKSEFVVKPRDILNYMEKQFLISLLKEIRFLGKRYGDIIQESKEEKAVTTVENEENVDEIDAAGIKLGDKRNRDAHESSDEDDEMDDDDATTAKLRSRHQESQEYEEPEGSEMELTEEEDEENEDEEGEMDESKKSEGNEERKGDFESDIETIERGDNFELNEEQRKTMEDRQNKVLSTFSIVRSYKYDVLKEEWCEIVIGIPLTLSKIDFSTVLRDICERSVIYQVPHIKRAIFYKDRSGDLTMKTEGINFIELFKYESILDLNRLYSNDIHSIAETYGIEAAVRVIVKELKEVFGVYGITVDPRHLTLIADYMTRGGYFSPLNRTGMADSPSPFQQMSFESSIGFLKNALFLAKKDELKSPSSRLMVGRYCASGTGAFDVIHDTRSFCSEKS